MYPVDASGWMNTFDQREPGHLVSRQFLEGGRGQAPPIILADVPLGEVAGAISRTRQTPGQAQAFAMALSRLPHVTVRVLDEVCVLHALTLAAQHGLRGADAVYAAVAHEAGSTAEKPDNVCSGGSPGRTPALEPTASTFRFTYASRPASLPAFGPLVP